MSPITVSATRSTREQRRIVRSLCDELRSDLYNRRGDDPQFPDRSALWESPGAWKVSYGCNLDGTTVWARIYNPSGERVAEAERLASADDAWSWLDGFLP